MDTLQLIASATGIGFLAGIRLYLTILALGLAIRFEWLELSESFSQLSILGDWKVIGVAAVAVIVEFVADKVPWLDSAWDSIHTLIRPLGAVFLTVSAFDSVDPGLRFLLVLLTGGAALTSHSAKAATRLAVNHSPEPFSNVALSLAGDAMVPLGVWLTMEYPLVVGGAVLVFALGVLLVAPRIYRVLRVETLAVAALLRSWMSGEEKQPLASSASIPSEAQPGQRLKAMLSPMASPLPEPYERFMAERFGVEHPFALRGVLRRGPSKLRNRIGYLCVLDDRFVFVAKKVFGLRAEEVTYESVSSVGYRGRMLLDELAIETAAGEVLLDLFKDYSEAGERLSEAWKLSRAAA